MVFLFSSAPFYFAVPNLECDIEMISKHCVIRVYFKVSFEMPTLYILWVPLLHELQLKVSRKANIRNRYNQVPHMTQITASESDKNTRELHIKASQEVSPFPAGIHKAAMKRQESIKKIKHIFTSQSTIFQRLLYPYFKCKIWRKEQTSIKVILARSTFKTKIRLVFICM